MIETVLDVHAIIGESATWVANERALFWIDVKAPALYRYCLDDGGKRCWPLTSEIGGFALTDDGSAVVALRRGLFRLDLDSGAEHLLAPPPFDPALFRFNEGACDANGRFWFGVMFDPLRGSLPAQAGKLHSFTIREGLRISTRYSRTNPSDLRRCGKGNRAPDDDGPEYVHSGKAVVLAFGGTIADFVASARAAPLLRPVWARHYKLKSRSSQS